MLSKFWMLSVFQIKSQLHVIEICQSKKAKVTVKKQVKDKKRMQDLLHRVRSKWNPDKKTLLDNSCLCTDAGNA
jgi:hypothetical protein